MKERSVIHSTFVIERTYPAKPERVFAAFSDPNRKRRWYGEGEEAKLVFHELDFRVGGTERTRRRLKPGWEFTGETIYRDIVPNQRIVFSYNMSVGDTVISTSQATVELLPSETGTELIFTEQGAFYEGSDGPKMREEGWSLLLDRLGRSVAN